MSGSVGLDELEPLLELVDDPARRVSESALGALVHLPLERAAWQQVSHRVLGLLDRLGRSGLTRGGSQSTHQKLFESASRVPVLEVRERLRELANSADIGIRRAAARALAGVRDPAAVPQLLEDLQGVDKDVRSAAIEDLVFFDPQVLDWQALRILEKVSRDPTRPLDLFYASIILARAEESRPLIRLLEVIRRDGSIFPGAPPDLSFLERLAFGSFELRNRLELFVEAGGPYDLAREIAEAVLTAGTSKSLEMPQPEGEPASEAAVAKAEGLAKSYLGSHLDEGWAYRMESDVDTLASLPPESATELVTGVYRRIAESTSGEDDGSIAGSLSYEESVVAGNAAVELVRQLRADLRPDLGDVLQTYRQLSASAPDAAEQLEWTISRTPADEILADLGEMLPATVSEDRPVLANLLEGVAEYAAIDDPPLFGSGGLPLTAPPEIELIDLWDSRDGALPEEAIVEDGGRGWWEADERSEGVPEDSKSVDTDRGGPKDGYSVPTGDDDQPSLGIKNKPSESDDPPRRFYALLDCPETVRVGREFELEVGLSRVKLERVFGGQLERPAASVGSYDLAVHVLADGFRVRPGQSLRVVLPVTAEKPYPTQTLILTAEAQSDPVELRTISATYSIGGQIIGVGDRVVAVVRGADLPGGAYVEEQQPGVDISVPANELAADLTLTIRLSDSRYWMTLENSHELPIPDEPILLELTDAQEFARALVDSVNVREGQEGSYQHLLGKARAIGDRLPDAFWQLLEDVTPLARARGRQVPSLLILSAEPYVPWELAAMETLIDEKAPPFLAAQIDVGRWIIRRGIPLVPPSRHSVESMSVVSGHYEGYKWRRLEHAEQEAEKLKASYGAHFVEADRRSVLKAIAGEPEVDLLHLAIHGNYNPGGRENGLILIDGEPIDPHTLMGTAMPRKLFVFLNACQVGTSEAVLSGYGGIAAAFLRIGAAGVIAPLWSIKDTHAQQIALDFYNKLHDSGQSAAPATLLRLERRKFKKADPPVSSTFMAYQFFGHPAMKLESKLQRKE